MIRLYASFYGFLTKTAISVKNNSTYVGLYPMTDDRATSLFIYIYIYISRLKSCDRQMQNFYRFHNI